MAAESSRRLYLDFSVSRSPEDGTVMDVTVGVVNDLVNKFFLGGGTYMRCRTWALWKDIFSAEWLYVYIVSCNMHVHVVCMLHTCTCTGARFA